MAMASPDFQWALICLLLYLTAVESLTDVRDMSIDEYINYVNPPAVHKFWNKHGDTILCVAYADQISLQGSEQRYAKSMNIRKMKSELNFSSNGVKTNCPEGTVSIMETKRELVERAGSVASFISKGKGIANLPTDLTVDGVGHEYGVMQFVTTEQIAGAEAGLNVWQPYVDTDDGGIFSLTQIWVLNTGNPLETLEAGLIVNPNTYGDINTRLFVFWTADGYNTTGCYNTDCPGFVLAPGASNYPGERVTPVSTYNGEQRQVLTKIIKETPDGNGARWSLYINNQLLGWWPVSLFKNLQRMADRVDFGGEVAFEPAAPGSKFTTTDMGSGHFPSEGFGHAATVWDIQITDNVGKAIDITGRKFARRPNCYDVSLVADITNGRHIFFGGPGGDNPGCVV